MLCIYTYTYIYIYIYIICRYLFIYLNEECWRHFEGLVTGRCGIRHFSFVEARCRGMESMERVQKIVKRCGMSYDYDMLWHTVHRIWIDMFRYAWLNLDHLRIFLWLHSIRISPQEPRDHHGTVTGPLPGHRYHQSVEKRIYWQTEGG